MYRHASRHSTETHSTPSSDAGGKSDYIPRGARDAIGTSTGPAQGAACTQIARRVGAHHGARPHTNCAKASSQLFRSVVDARSRRIKWHFDACDKQISSPRPIVKPQLDTSAS